MTTVQSKGQWQRTEALTWAAGQPLNFKLHILGEFAESMQAPEITDIKIEVTGTCDVDAADDILPEDYCKLLTNILIKDQGGELVNVSGNGLRLWDIFELADKAADPDGIDAGAANASRTVFFRLPQKLLKAARGRDTTMQSWQMTEGGTVTVRCASALPTGFDAFTGATVTVHFKVADGRRRESKSRLRMWEYAATKREDSYAIDGQPRLLALFTDLDTTGMTAWTATEVESTALGFPPGMSIAVLRDDYLKHIDGAVHESDPFLAGTAIPLLYAERGQKIGSLPDLKDVRIKLNADPPANAKLLVVAVVDRPERLAAKQLGYPDVGSAQRALMAQGRLESAKGNHLRLGRGKVMDKLQRRLPASVKSVSDADNG